MVSVNQSNTTEILHVGTFAGHIGHRPLHVHCGGKGTAPHCAPFVGAQRYQALVKLTGKENKEQRGKRKFHAGTPHPNDRGGFTEWFGSCSLISTLYVWFPASWAPMVGGRLFGLSSHPRRSSYPQWGQPASGPPHMHSETFLAPIWSWRCWFQWGNGRS